MRKRREGGDRMFVMEAMEVAAETAKVERGVSEGGERMGGGVSGEAMAEDRLAVGAEEAE